MVYLALELVGPWVVLGFSVGMEAFDELLKSHGWRSLVGCGPWGLEKSDTSSLSLSLYRLMFPGVRSSLLFSGFGLKPPASGFQFYSNSSLKTSPSPFKDNGLPFWVPDVLCQHSEVVLWNLLSVQMFFQ